MEQQAIKVVKKERKIKGIQLVAIILILTALLGYAMQTNKQVYLTYENVKLNKQIEDLEIKAKELSLENERLKTNEYIEKIAQEKLGMVYADKDKVVIMKEKSSDKTAENEDRQKIKIFMQSIYQESLKQIQSFSMQDFIKSFIKK